jgi:K+/H+ antiporter YhaU regulatory subunit KhtT
MSFDIINLALLILITLLEFVAFGWLIYEMKKSHSERDKILRLEEKQIALERRILKTLDITQLASTPDLIEFLDHIAIEGKTDINLEELDVDLFYHNTMIKTIGDLNAKHKTGCSVIGFKNQSGEYIINPSLDTILQEGSKLFVLGNVNQVQQLNNMLNLN